jgi:hypothetical protein
VEGAADGKVELRRLRRGGGRDWTGSGWGAREGGAEAQGSGDLVGRVGSRRISVRNQRRWFGVARRKKGSSSGRERERVGSVCSSAQCVEEKEKRRESTWPGAERQAAPV